MKSLRQRLTIGLLAGLCLLWAVGGTALYLAIRSGLIAEFDDTLKATAQGLAAMTEQQNGAIQVDGTEEFMPGFERRWLPDYFQIWLPDGTSLRRSTSLGNDELPNQVLSTRGKLQLWNLRLPDGRLGRALGIQFVPQMEESTRGKPENQKLTEPVTLVVARHRDMLDHRLRTVATALLLVGGAMAALTIIAVPVMVRRGLGPLDDLELQISGVDALSLKQRFPTAELPVELRPICERLNELLGRLEASFERERQLSADVAHELRTPIAELRTLSEVALRWPEDPAIARTALQDALDVALRMESISTGLLALARCGGGLLPLHLGPTPVAPLVHEICQLLSADASARQIIFFVNVPDDASWVTDATLLRAIVDNLVSNAVQYCADSGSIHVNVEPGRLLVSNTTNELAPDDLPHLFERFWRKDSARSAGVHNGLGLALAKAYADALGMELRADLIETSEILFVLSGGRTTASLPA